MSDAYDHMSKTLIITDYAQRFHWFHQVHPDAIRARLEWIVYELTPAAI